MGIAITTPAALLALALLPVIVWIERRAFSEQPPWRRSMVVAARLLEVLLVVLAVAGLRLTRENHEVCVIFGIDVSRSTPESARDDALAKIAAASDAMGPGDRAGVLVFAGEPLLEAIPTERPRIGEIDSRPDPDFTDLAAVLRLAAGVFPEGFRRRLVLFTDGNENRGDALDALKTLEAAGIEVDVFPVEAARRSEVILARLDLPGRVEKDQPFEMRVEVVATDPGPATLRFFRDGGTLGRREVMLEPGRNRFSLTFTEERPGFHTYEAFIESAADLSPENNVAGAFTRVAGPSRVLIVGSSAENAPLTNALDLTRLQYESSPFLPSSLAALLPYDAVILNNVAAEEFDPRQLAELERYTRDLGGGLGMIGGERSFGPGGWIGTPVERALPVNMEIKTREKFPSLALAMVIDKSGSMGGMVGATSKMELASQAAVEAIKLLGPQDQVGVVAFDSAGKWVVPMQGAEDKESIERAVLSMRPGGGTDAMQGARMAFEGLTQVESKLKHIILLTDGHTAHGDYVQLLSELNQAAVTISTIAVGTDADQLFLEMIARNGRGRFYYCPDPSRVPRIFVRETILVQRSYIKEETAEPVLGALHPILDDEALGAMPPLHGWVVTEPKNRAETVLSIDGDPLLSVWQYGLGKSVAFSSDAKARWARDWVGWEGYQSFWDRTIRWTLRSLPAEDLHPRMEFDRGKGRLSVEAASVAGKRLNLLSLKARLVRPDLSVQEIVLRQTALGTYEAEFEAHEPGAYLAGITEEQGRQSSVGGMVAYSPEFKDFAPNQYLLHEIAQRTGGKVEPKIEEIFRRSGPPVRSSKPMTGALLAAALVALLFEVAVRRLYFDEEQIAAARAWMLRWKPLRAAPAEAGLTAALKSRSRKVKARLRQEIAPAKPKTPAPGRPPALGHGLFDRFRLRPPETKKSEGGTKLAPPGASASPKPLMEKALLPTETLAQLRRRRGEGRSAEPGDIPASLEPQARPRETPAEPKAPSEEQPPASPPAAARRHKPIGEGPHAASDLAKAKRRRREETEGKQA